MPRKQIDLTFTPAKETKGTWKFDEVVTDDAEPKVGTLYVRKSTLDELAHVEGEQLIVTLSAFAPTATPTK